MKGILPTPPFALGFPSFPFKLPKHKRPIALSAVRFGASPCYCPLLPPSIQDKLSPGRTQSGIGNNNPSFPPMPTRRSFREHPIRIRFGQAVWNHPLPCHTQGDINWVGTFAHGATLPEIPVDILLPFSYAILNRTGTIAVPEGGPLREIPRIVVERQGKGKWNPPSCRLLLYSAIKLST